MGQGNSDFNDDNTRVAAIEDNDGAVKITINNIMYTVSLDISVDTSLNTFIRDVVKLKGTKVMCHEGGCGACIVAAEMNGNIMSVNSCLVPVYICDGWKITTIKGIGNKKKGYHSLQAALADMNGSQCGFCSPGWVMNMFSLTQNNKMSMKEIENSFAGNLCRCTGYRPILDAFKSFANDAPPMMKTKIKDIEESYNIQTCKNCPKKMCNGTCDDLEIIYTSSIPRTIKIVFKNSVTFHKVLKIDHVFEIFQNNPEATYTINGGNTAHGTDNF